MSESEAQRELRLFKLQFEKAGLADAGAALERWVTTGDEAARAIACEAAPRAAKAAAPDWARPLFLARDGDPQTDRLFEVAVAGFGEPSAWLTWATNSIRVTGRFTAATRYLQRRADREARTPSFPWSSLSSRPPAQVYFPVLDALLEAVEAGAPELAGLARERTRACFFDPDELAGEQYAQILAGEAPRPSAEQLAAMAAPPPPAAPTPAASKKRFVPFEDIWGTKRDRASDIEAWLDRGDEAALGRLASGASQSAKHWKALGASGMDELDPASRARALRLVRSAKSESDLLAWLVVEGASEWLDTFEASLDASNGRQPAPPLPFARDTYDRRNEARARLLRALASDRPTFVSAIRTLEENVPQLLWDVLGLLGARSREQGNWGVRTFGPMALERRFERRKLVLRLRTFEADAEAQSFADALEPKVDAPKPPKPRKVTLGDREGMVSLWMDAKLDPRGTLDGKGGPVGWFDHDNWEIVHGTPQVAFSKMSYASSFAPAAIARAIELGLTGEARFEAIFDVVLPVAPGKQAYGWFLGSFPYTRTPRA